MRLAIVLAFGMVCALCCAAQARVPAGTVIAVTLDHGIKAGDAHPGQPIRARVEQGVPGTPIKRHSHVLGQVVSAGRGVDGRQRLAIRFTDIQAGKRQIPLRAGLRAIASFTEVADAQTPEDGGDRSEPPEVNTFRQIGGEEVYRGGGPVADGSTVVGKPAPYGVLVTPRPNGVCRGVVAEATGPQAFWVFSSNACGVYGIPNLRIEDAGRESRPGTIVLEAKSGRLNLPAGTALLLRCGRPAER